MFIVLDTNILLSHLKFIAELKDSPIPGKCCVTRLLSISNLFIVLDTNILLSHLKFISELKESPIPGKCYVTRLLSISFYFWKSRKYSAIVAKLVFMKEVNAILICWTASDT